MELISKLKGIKLYFYIFCILFFTLFSNSPVGASDQQASTLSFIISNIAASNITSSSATVSWQTNITSTSQVFYDIRPQISTDAYANHTALGSDLVKDHSQTLGGLQANTDYYYRVKSSVTISATDLIAVSDEYTFHALAASGGGGGGGGGGFGGGGSQVLTILVKLVGLTSSGNIELSLQGKTREMYQLKTSDNNCTLVIPSGTAITDARGQPLTSLNAIKENSPPTPPPDSSILLAYDFGPNGARFEPAITLTFNIGPPILPYGNNLQNVQVAFWNGTSWDILQGNINAATNTLSFSTNHFTVFALIYSGKIAPVSTPTTSIAPTAIPTTIPIPSQTTAIKLPAVFTLSKLTISPVEVNPDGIITTSIWVDNSGDLAGTLQVIFKIDEVVTGNKILNLAGRTKEKITFDSIQTAVGRHTVDINGQTGTFNVVNPKSAAPTPKNPRVWFVVGIVIFSIILIFTTMLTWQKKRSSI